MGPELCRDKPRTPGLTADAGGRGCAMARALLLPSFHSRICLAASQLRAETWLLLLLLLLPGGDSTNQLPVDAALYQSWYQRFAERAEGALLTRLWGLWGLQGARGFLCASASLVPLHPSVTGWVEESGAGQSWRARVSQTELGVV